MIHKSIQSSKECQKQRNLWTPFLSSCLGPLDISKTFQDYLSADSVAPNIEDQGRVIRRYDEGKAADSEASEANPGG